MNSQFKLKFLQYLNAHQKTKGFTLVELLVVVIIIGILAAIALPNLLSQVAKGRQSEAKNALGVINRAQQAYRAERSTFTVISNLPVSNNFQYYQPAAGGANDQTFASHGLTAQTTYANDIRAYSSAVAQSSSGNFSAIICENNSPTVGGAQTINTATSLTSANCPANTQQVK